MISEKELTAYYKAIRKNLNCSPKAKANLLLNLQTNVLEFIHQRPLATINDVYSHFGLPENFAKESIISMEDEDLYKATSKRKSKGKIIFSLCIAIFIVAISIGICIVISNNQHVTTYYDETVSQEDIEVN